MEGILKRAVATKLADPNRWFTFTHASVNMPDEAIDEVLEIGPHSMVTIDQDFTVDERTLEFSEGYLILELLLSDPMVGTMRSVQKHRMHMQISAPYSLSPNPSCLLVLNSKTPSHSIRQVINLIRDRLHTHLDIFNLSLTGSWESPVTGEMVLKSYIGKSVVIFGNSFPYFNQGDTLPWDLLDPWQTGLLVKGGTNILFVGVSDIKVVQDWADKATFPAHDITADENIAGDVNPCEVIADLGRIDPWGLTSEMEVRRLSVRKPMFRTLQATVNSTADSMAKELNKNFPLRRFMVVPDASATKGDNKRAEIVVIEGVPKNSKMLACSSLLHESPPGMNSISDYDMYYIVSKGRVGQRLRCCSQSNGFHGRQMLHNPPVPILHGTSVCIWQRNRRR
jgi:hypothetical protein